MKHVIYSNYNLDERFDETKQFVIDEYPDLEPSDDTVWDFIYEEDTIEWDAIWHELKNFFENKTVIMYGTTGRWNGTFAGGKIGEFEDLFNSLIRDCDYVEIEDNNGHMNITCSHHDGTNSMEVKILSSRGDNFAENWAYDYSPRYDFSEEELHEKIVKNNFLSALPHFAKSVYGI